MKKTGLKYLAVLVAVALLSFGYAKGQSTTPQTNWNSGGQDFLHLNTLGKLVFYFNGQGQSFAGVNNCQVNSVSPAACGNAWIGSFVVPTTTTTYTVNTTGVTANSVIAIEARTFAGNLPSTPTCVAPASSLYYVSAVVAGTSFTLTLPSTSGTTCFSFRIDD
jgi:hypothetical protein